MGAGEAGTGCNRGKHVENFSAGLPEEAIMWAWSQEDEELVVPLALLIETHMMTLLIVGTWLISKGFVSANSLVEYLF